MSNELTENTLGLSFDLRYPEGQNSDVSEGQGSRQDTS